MLYIRIFNIYFETFHFGAYQVVGTQWTPSHRQAHKQIPKTKAIKFNIFIRFTAVPITAQLRNCNYYISKSFYIILISLCRFVIDCPDCPDCRPQMHLSFSANSRCVETPTGDAYYVIYLIFTDDSNELLLDLIFGLNMGMNIKLATLFDYLKWEKCNFRYQIIFFRRKDNIKHILPIWKSLYVLKNSISDSEKWKINQIPLKHSIFSFFLHLGCYLCCFVGRFGGKRWNHSWIRTWT